MAPKKKANPIHSAVHSWLDSLPPTLIEAIATQLGIDDTNEAKQQLIDRAPKRWVVYEPMVLLPSGSFISSPWPSLLDSLTTSQKDSLWTAILHNLSPPSPKPPLTHLAVNEGIPLHVTQSSSETETKSETGKETETDNLLRSPSGLRLLSGCFGPSSPTTDSSPSASDFAAALWVSTKQNGIFQTWAPRYTMFSRGNIKEKARLLDFHKTHPHSDSNSNLNPVSTSTSTSTPIPTKTRASKSKPTPSPPNQLSSKQFQGKYAVDLYAGIGYFAFSYARLGLRVLCWEINPWSVEGLRRGAEMNGWSIRVVLPNANGSGDGDGVDMTQVLAGPEQIIVFLEDNKKAAGRIAQARGAGAELEVVHVNCGFLPTSEPVWRDAWEVQTGGGGEGEGWLHLHENVGVADVEGRKKQIQGLLDRWAQEEEGCGGSKREASVQHVEFVKTYAPGVWHCVFDVSIDIKRSSTTML